MATESTTPSDFYRANLVLVSLARNRTQQGDQHVG